VNLLIVDPNLSLSSPSMKGFIRSLPMLKADGFHIEAWCWHCDEGLQIDNVVKMPHIGDVHTLRGYAFSLLVRLRSWWLYTVQKQPKPDIIYSVASYLANCDICHVHFSSVDWEARQKLLGIHNLRDLFDRVTNGLNLLFARHFFLNTTARSVLSVSEAVANDVKNENPNLRVSLLPNSFDPERFNTDVRATHRTQMRAKLNFTEGESVFVFASAGHYRRKGFFLAVAAVAKLRQNHPKARFLVVGGREQTLAGLQKKLDTRYPGWRDWITFTGMVSDVEKYFAASDALLFPSYSEAFALVEVEAAACGLPLILTRHHGSEMILQDGLNGRFVEFDSDDIARVLGEFVSGAWTPKIIPLPNALDIETYAQRLIAELRAVA
jgi:glycosyltransferase involved in cell wall biosynthesis